VSGFAEPHARPTADGGAECELVTIPISHFCEKARWALERAGVPYRERAHLQVIHRLVAKRAGGGDTVPVLVCEDGVLADSADILAYADGRAESSRKLYPDDPDEAAEVRELERDFDARLGPESRRWMYYEMRGERELVRRYGTTGVPAWERRTMPMALPAMQRVIDHFLDVTPTTAAHSEREVRATFDAVAERLSDGRPYLMGERFTAADLTFSALAAAVLMPPEYGVPLPQPNELPARMAETVREMRAHPAGAHALAMFRTERRVAH
jgi:glutathione S-transferase